MRYIYNCDNGHIHNLIHSPTDEEMNKERFCSECGKLMHRVIQPVGWIARCSGFYRTDKVLSEKSDDD